MACQSLQEISAYELVMIPRKPKHPSTDDNNRALLGELGRSHDDSGVRQSGTKTWSLKGQAMLSQRANRLIESCHRFNRGERVG